MFAIPGILLLLVQGYTRPQEFVAAIRSVPFLYLFFALALFGFVVDLRLRQSKLFAAPQLPWIVGFYVWALFTIGHRMPGRLNFYAVDLAVTLSFGLLLAHGVQSFRAFSAVAATLLGIALFLAVVGVNQGTAPLGCLRLNPSSQDVSGVWDGRYCEHQADCSGGDVDPGAEYVCEHIGQFGTSSVADGRVRYRGSLNDPNELALALSVGLPFAFAFYERKRSTGRLLILLASLVLIGAAMVMTRSRGGQLVFLSVLGVYFAKRYGTRGLVVGALVALPFLLLSSAGGRSDAEASSQERITMMNSAIELFGWHPFRGIGMGQILEYQTLTAHNSYALAAAELGLPGMVLWSGSIYVSFKVLVTILRRFADDPAAAVARTWAMALLASLTGMTVGIFFLSFCYHIVFWIYIGLVGALYQACRAHDPELQVQLDKRDSWRLIGIDLGLIALIWGYTTLKMG